MSSRYIQYRAIFEYPNPAYLPVLFEVKIEYSMGEQIIVEPDTSSSILPQDTAIYETRVINNTKKDDIIEISYKNFNEDWKIILTDTTGNPLTDTDNDGNPDTGLLSKNGGKKKLILKVHTSS